MEELYQVFHVRQLSEVNQHADPPEYPPLNYEHYEHVVTVSAVSLNHVYELTKHIDHDWRENPQIKWRLNSVTRSLSVGDLVTKVDVRDNRLWRVAPFGFDMIGYSDKIWPPLFPPTPEQYDERYIKTNTCPICGLDGDLNFNIGESTDAEGGVVIEREVWCGNCHASWVVHFHLIGISNIKMDGGEPAPLREV